MWNFKKRCLLLCLILSFLISGCASITKPKQHTFQISDITMSKGFREKDHEVYPIGQTQLFSLFDKQIFCFVNYVNLTGSHSLRWEWLAPEGKLYRKTAEFQIHASADRIIKRGTAMHMIEIGRNAPHSLTGTWEVKIYSDGALVKKIQFKIISHFGRGNALLIGNNAYPDFEVPSLRNAVHDVEELSRILRQNYDYNIIKLLNADRRDIITAMSNFQQSLTEEDNLLIYYAGHGWYDDDRNEGYWLPVDSSPRNRSQWISNSTISKELRAMRARNVIVITDSCYSGLTRGIVVKKNLLRFATPVKKSRLAISSGGLNPVLDGGGRNKHSIFAYHLINVLKENDAVLNAAELYGKLYERLEIDSSCNESQLPEYGIIIGTGHEKDGDYYFVRNNQSENSK